MQLDWLEQELSDKTTNLVFVHHPPLDCKTPFMDQKYPLLNRDEAWKRLKKLKIDGIFCGHYHIEKELEKDGIKVFLTPSTAFQMAGDAQEYSVSDERAGFREISIDESGALKTRCIYLD